MYRTLIGAAAAVLLSVGASAQTTAPQAHRDAPSNSAVKNSDVEQASVAASGANSFTEGQARTRIAKAGYTGVSKLMKDDAGLWQGMAKKGRKSVHVALDYKGNVTSK